MAKAYLRIKHTCEQKIDRGTLDTILYHSSFILGSFSEVLNARDDLKVKVILQVESLLFFYRLMKGNTAPESEPAATAKDREFRFLSSSAENGARAVARQSTPTASAARVAGAMISNSSLSMSVSILISY